MASILPPPGILPAEPPSPPSPASTSDPSRSSTDTSIERSAVWKHFWREGDQNRCTFCGWAYSRLKNSSTTNMRRHLEARHSATWQATLAKRALAAQTQRPPPLAKPTAKQATLPYPSPPAPSAPLPKPTAAQERRALSVVLMAAEINVSLRSLADSRAFRNMMQHSLRWDVPPYEVLSALLPTHYAHLSAQLKTRLDALDSIAITTESAVLARTQAPHLTITAHYIDSQWKLHHTLLAAFVTGQKKGGAYTVGQLQGLLKRTADTSQPLHCITTNEGATLLAAASSGEEREVVSDSALGACQALHVAMTSSLASPTAAPLKRMLDKCHHLVWEFRKGRASRKREREVWRHCQQAQIDRLQQAMDTTDDGQSGDVISELTAALHSERAEDQRKADERAAEERELLDVFPGRLPNSELVDDDPSSDEDDEADADFSPSDTAAVRGRRAEGTDGKEEAGGQVEAKQEGVVGLDQWANAIHLGQAHLRQCARRWPAYLRAAERVLMWREAFHSAAAQLIGSDYPFQARRGQEWGAAFDADSIRLTDDEAEVLRQFIEVVAPVREALDASEASSQPTLSNVLFCCSALHNHLDSASHNAHYHELVRGLASHAHRHASVQLTWDARDREAVLAACLDPRYRQLHFLPQAQRSAFQLTLSQAYEQLHPPKPAAVPGKATTASPTAKKAKLDLNQLGGFTPPRRAGEELTECDAWFAAPNVGDEEADVLGWWRENEGSFPTLAKIARRYLAMPPSSMLEERASSRLKELLTTRHESMSAKSLCQLLFVKQHHPEHIALS